MDRAYEQLKTVGGLHDDNLCCADRHDTLTSTCRPIAGIRQFTGARVIIAHWLTGRTCSALDVRHLAVVEHLYIYTRTAPPTRPTRPITSLDAGHNSYKYNNVLWCPQPTFSGAWQ